MRVPAWLDSLRGDAAFAWRQLNKHKVTSATAILSVGLAIGACTAAFRLADSLFLRPLPIFEPRHLYVLARPVAERAGDGWEYMRFRAMRAALAQRSEIRQPELIAVSFVEETDVSYPSRSDRDVEKANLQYVTGEMFPSFGLQPALGRLLRPDDERASHPVAVLSWDYWTHRFGRDAKVVGRTVTIARKYGVGSEVFDIVGVARDPFTGTEPGTPADIFVPATTHPFVNRTPAGVFRIFVRLPLGLAPAAVRDRLDGILRALNQQDGKTFSYRADQTLSIEAAASGISAIQRNYRPALAALGVLAALVLLIAIANVSNLMSAQASARTREMAVRVSIGAGRAQLIRLVLVESAMMALMASGAGAIVAWQAAPFVIARINPPDNPARLSLAADYRVFGFGLTLIVAITILLGLAPALRASGVAPATVLRGGKNTRRQGRSMRFLIAAQTSFCFVVLFLSALLGASFMRLTHQTYGFTTRDLVALDTVTPRDEPPSAWRQVAEHLRMVPGVESVGISEWPLLDGNGYRLNDVSIEGGPPTDTVLRFLTVSSGWLQTMRIPLIEGRDLGPEETEAAMVNRAFVRQYLGARDPIGRWFQAEPGGAWGSRFRIVGVVGDTGYRSVRDPILPLVLIPYRGAWHVETFMVRMAHPRHIAGAAAAASILREEVARARPGFRVTRVRTQQAMLEAQTVRERLLAILGLFFAGVALLLAGIGLYGVLDYSVSQRRHEIGVRMAIGAQASEIVRRVTSDIAGWVAAGSFAGLAAVVGIGRYMEPLLFQVKSDRWSAFPAPVLALLTVAIVASLPPAIRAVRTDPARVLRSE